MIIIRICLDVLLSPIKGLYTNIHKVGFLCEMQEFISNLFSLWVFFPPFPWIILAFVYKFPLKWSCVGHAIIFFKWPVQFAKWILHTWTSFFSLFFSKKKIIIRHFSIEWSFYWLKSQQLIAKTLKQILKWMLCKHWFQPLLFLYL